MLQATANHLWQSTLFAAAIAVLCHVLRKDGAHVRYWLWWIASVKFLVPFAWLAALGARFADAPAVAFTPPSWTVGAELVARPFADTAEPSTLLLLLVLWPLGSLAVLACWLERAARLRATLRSAAPAVAPGPSLVEVRRTSDIIEPGVVGLFRPILLLPEGLDRRLTRAELDAVLAHELCHVRRRDNLTATVHMLVEAVFWFHPLVWWIGARLIDERERACDECVVALGHDREAYAEGILNVCEHYAATRLACASGISGSDLKRRITQIMRYEGMSSLKPIKKILLTSAAFAALAAPVVAGLTIQRAAIAQEAQEPASQPAPSEAAGADAAAEEWLPVVKVAPLYPPRAAARGLEGEVIVEYTVTSTGTVKDVVVIESTSSLFDRSAIESVSRYRYKPREDNGVAVDVPGVRSKIIFVLENNPPAAERTSPDNAE